MVSLYRMFKDIRPNGTELGDGLGLWIRHVNGDINRVEPTQEFQGFLMGVTMVINFRGDAWVVSKSDIMPNWYLSSDGSDPKIIESTKGESLAFVGPFTTDRQWKRATNDMYDPYTPEVRLELSGVRELGEAPLKVLPQPVEEELSDQTLSVDQDWFVVRGRPESPV